MLLIAHRGESFLAPENTLASINLAWEKGARAVEVDVQLTQDKELAVIHDKNTRRTGDKNKIVEKSTMMELRTVDVGLFKGEEWRGERIPCLSKVLETVPDDGKLIVEIKCGREAIPFLVADINKSGLRKEQIEIISFNYRVLREMKKYLPDYKMLWLLDLDYFWPVWMLRINTKRIRRKLSESGLDGINVWAGKILTQSFLQKFKEEKVSVYCWTVNDPIQAKELIGMGIDAITTDRPEWMKRQLSDQSL